MERNDPLKIYFACSIRGEQGGLEEKELIVGIMKDLGHNVLSEIFLTQDINQNESLGTLTPAQIFDRDIAWVKESDVVVADVTRVSLGVGIEIGYKLAQNGQVVAICHQARFKSLSNMAKNQHHHYKLIIWSTPEELNLQLEQTLGRAVPT